MKAIISFALLFFSFTSLFSQTFTIGTGTSSNTSTGYPAPYGQYYNSSRHQLLIRASELTAAGVTTERRIQTFALNCAAAAGANLPLFSIKMGQTTATALTTTFVTGLTQVFYASSYTSTAGWNTHNLTTPFMWDGTSNLVVDVCFSNYPNGFTTNAQHYNTTASFNACSYVYSDGADQCPSTTASTVTTLRPNMRFTIATPTAYDVIMNSIVSPASFGVGNNTLTVQIANYGNTTMTSCDIGYQLGSGTPFTENVTFSPGKTTGQSYNHTYSTALNIPASGTYTLKIWARNPNGVGPDGNVNNDTITTTICTGMSGAYTINPSGTGPTNYTTFTAAANALSSCGVAGACYFTVSPGTYTEKFTLVNVQGTSAINTITIDGIDSSTRVLTFNETTTASNIGVITLLGTSYVTIKNMKIVNTGVTYGAGVSIQNGSHYNTVTNCRINVGGASSTYLFGVGICGSTYSTTSTGSNNTIKNNKIVGGYAGIDLYGTSTTVFTSGNKIIGNDISGCYLYGIFDYYQTFNEVTDNRIYLTTATNTYGIYSYYCQNNIVDRNNIVAAYMGLYLYNNNNAGTTRMSCSNNIVNLNGPYNYSTNYGLYALYNVNGDFKHNTIYTAPAIASGYASYVGYGSGCVFKNNIFHSNNGAMYAIYCPSITFTSFDYNIIYAPPGTNYVYWGAAYTSLAALKAAAPLFHQNSLFKTVNFKSMVNQAEDLHLSSATPADVAELSSALTVDVDNETRCVLAPSIGADDSKYGAGTLVANYSTPDSIFVNSPTTYVNYVAPGTPSYKFWYLDGVLISTAHDLTYTFTATGTYDLKLKVVGCFAIDSITKTITVHNLTQKPIANFISDLNTVSTNQNVSFKDLSSKGPSYFNWTVTPTVGVSFVNGTNNNSQNPVMSFATAGTYTICLWDSNALGRSNTVCKTAYILVTQTVLMCTSPFDTKVGSGTMFDDGGANLNYTVNKTCNFLIDPCASSVSLSFKSFNLASGTYFRAYNGTDNSATPLHTGLGFTGVTLPGTLTASSGKMYVEFVTGATAAAGFEATWTSVAGTFPAPSGAIIAPDTTDDCGSLSTFKFNSNDASFNKDAADYSWYFGNTSFPQFSDKGLHSVQFGFTTAGVYPIKLEVNGCGGTSTFYDTLRVIAINTPPTIDFSASIVRGTITDIITLTDLSKYGTVSRLWTISGPGSITNVTGTNTSSVYSFKLGTAGLYSVKLVGGNCKGEDSLTKTGYITIFNYCIPAVSNLNSDMSISNVTFGRIDTAVNGEVKGFDYTNSVPAIGTVTYRDNTNKVKTYSFGTKAVEAIVDIGATYNFSVTRYGNLNSANTKIWIDYNQDGTFQATELAASSGALNGKTYSGSITIPMNATIGVTRMRIGTAVGVLGNAPCGTNLYGDFNDFRIKITPDLTLPVISFTGADVLSVEVGRIFTEPGYSVSDNITNPCPFTYSGVTSGTQITSHPSTTSYTITATDAAGNISTRTRTINSSADVTKPIITLIGSSTVYVEVGTSYSDSGATANDFFFGSLTSSIVNSSTVNTAVTGTYAVNYNVTDAAGNAATTVTRTVIVRDSQKPVINVSGTNPLYVEVLSSFTPPTATVTDNYCTGLTYNVSGIVNNNVLGTYTLTYKSTDCSGNDAVPVVLNVIVRDTKAPTLIFIVGDTVIVDVNTQTTVPEPGYILNDNYYNIGALTVNVNYSSVKLNIVGLYPVKFYISDPSGNIDSSKVRFYKVVDRVAPVISLIGSSFIDWKRWAPYVDPGTIVTDNYYTGLTTTMDASQLNIYLDGTYAVKFRVTDPSGNVANEVIRYVRVYTAPSGINTGNENKLISIYPNPNNGVLNLSLNFDNTNYANITIFDAKGKMVYNNSINQPSKDLIQIDLSNQASGMYFIQVTTNNSSTSRSFTIQK